MSGAFDQPRRFQTGSVSASENVLFVSIEIRVNLRMQKGSRIGSSVAPHQRLYVAHDITHTFLRMGREARKLGFLT